MNNESYIDTATDENIHQYIFTNYKNTYIIFKSSISNKRT